MLNEKVAKLLNEQVNKEFYSAYLYLSFSNFYKELGLDGFANWYNVQAQEERDHAMLFIQYMQNNDAKITFDAIDKPASDFQDHMEVLKAGLDHERYVTGLINNIYLHNAEIGELNQESSGVECLEHRYGRRSLQLLYLYH